MKEIKIVSKDHHTIVRSEQIKWLPDDYDHNNGAKHLRPFHTFIIKIASRCNMDCSYCYVYQGPDQSWKEKPKFSSRITITQVATKIEEHVNAHSLLDVTIVFHGGEPLLAGINRLEEWVSIFNEKVGCTIHYGMQTNGSLLNEKIADFFYEHKFRIGISLDGTKTNNDKHRIYLNGESTYDDTIAAIKLIQSKPTWKQAFGGILVVVDLDTKPFELLKAISDLEVTSANLLLPDNHHESQPYRKNNNQHEYGIWLSTIFNLWYDDFQHLEIPYFEEIISLMMGGNSASEEIGAESVDLVVVETNGDIEAVDTLKVVGRSATSLELNLGVNSFDDALKHPAIYSRMSGFDALALKCRECQYLKNCGAGYLPHRYSRDNGFINPSVYCNDLIYLFKNVEKRVFESGGSNDDDKVAI